jgi:hypothetical protein
MVFEIDQPPRARDRRSDRGGASSNPTPKRSRNASESAARHAMPRAKPQERKAADGALERLAWQ